MIIHPGFVGIDISKDTLDVFCGTTQRSECLANAAEAIAALVERLRARGSTLVVFEATGRYDARLRAALAGAGLAFARVNPARARDFARSLGLLAKTDKLDARMLAAMGQCLALKGDAAADPDRERLALLHKRRDQLVTARKQEQTRLTSEASRDIQASLAEHLVWLDAAIARLDQHIAQLVARHERFEAARRLMCSVPGIGPVTSTTLLALMPELGARSHKAIAALAGLAPFNRDSGQARGVRQIHGGRRRVRQALYMAAVSASRSKSRFAASYRALRQAGKPAKLALIAIARKLLVTLNAILRNNVAFQV